MRKLLLSFIFGILLISSISAWDWDNVYSYNENSRTVTITNAFGIGERLARIQLMSELDVKVIDRGEGVYQQVALIKFHEWADSSNALEGISLYDVKNGMSNIKGRDIIMKYRTDAKPLLIPIYETQCSGDNSTRVCNQVQIGTREEPQYTWTEFKELSELPKKNMFIGLFADVQPNEKVEWIPDVWFGERIEEWAVWTEGLSLITQHYYAFDENTGTNVRDEIFGFQKNLTVTGNGWSGLNKINTSYFSAPLEGVDMGFNIGNFSNQSGITVSLWMNVTTDSLTNCFLLSTGSNSNTQGKLSLEVVSTPTRYRWEFGSEPQLIGRYEIVNKNWHHYVFMMNTTTATGYMDGGVVGTVATTASDFKKTPGNFRLFNQNGQCDGQAIDELAFFNRTLTASEVSDLYNGGAGIQYKDMGTSSPTDYPPTVTLNLPLNNTITINNTPIFNCTAEDDSLIQNVTLYINGVANYTETNGLTNFTSMNVTVALQAGNYNWTCKASDNATTIGYGWANSNFTLTIKDITENSVIFNATSFETAIESYWLNVTASNDLDEVKLVYNGTSYSMSNSSKEIWNLTRELNGLNVGNQTFNFSYHFGGTTKYGSNYQQNVSELRFNLCDSDDITTFLNISFKDETTNAVINATVSSGTFEYYLGSGVSTKNFTFTETYGNFSYALCGNVNRTYHVNPYLQYASSTAPQRIWNPSLTDYSNTTTNQVLYLLGTDDGIYVTFQVVNVAEQPLSGVLVNGTKDIFGTTQLVANGLTDDSGGITFWLNPSFPHFFSFSKSGYSSFTTTITPTQNSYTINLGGDSSSFDKNDYTKGISFKTEPSEMYLTNNTYYIFRFNITSSFWEIEKFGFRLVNNTGFSLGSTSALTNGGSVFINVSSGRHERLKMEYFWVINSTYTNGTRGGWYIYDDTINTQWSIKNFFTDLKTYISLRPFGLNELGVSIIFFLVIFITTGIMSYKFGLSSPTMILLIISALIAFLESNSIGIINLTGGDFPLGTVISIIATIVIGYREFA